MSIISQLKKKRNKQTPTTIYYLSQYWGGWGSAEVLTRASHVAAARQWLGLEFPGQTLHSHLVAVGKGSWGLSWGHQPEYYYSRSLHAAWVSSQNSDRQALPHRMVTGKQHRLFTIPLLKLHSTN